MNASSPLPPPPRATNAVIVLMVIAGIGLVVSGFRQHGKLTAELAALRSGETSSAGQIDGVPSAEGVAISAELEKETALLRAAEARVAEIAKALPPMSGEEWRSLGRVEELGQQAGDFLRTFSEAAARMKSGQTVDGVDGATLRQMTPWMKRMEAIGEMEDDPKEIARLHTATLNSRMKLDAATQTRVQQQIEREFAQLREQKLTRAQIPGDGRDDWYARRRKALNEAAVRVEGLIPPMQRVEHAVMQSLHLGTGLRTKVEVDPDGHGNFSAGFDFFPGFSND